MNVALAALAPDQEEQTQTIRTELATWASSWQERISPQKDLRDKKAADLLSTLRKESEGRAHPQTADVVEAFQAAIGPILTRAQKPFVCEQIVKLVAQRLPVFVYFENYGILDSAIYLPRFLEDMKSAPGDLRVRTVNAMFKHVGLTAQKITDLGRERAQEARAQKQEPTAEMIAEDQSRKEARAIKLNSASLDITRRFNEWYQQRRHSNVETWPSDRETIFPLQAAGYAMLRGLFQHKKNVFVEGMSDYYYLHALSEQCRATGRASLPADVYITPCGDTKLVGHIASLFLGQEVRPLVLLDGDDVVVPTRRDDQGAICGTPTWDFDA